MYKPQLGAIVWRKHAIKYMKPDTDYMKEALASNRKVKYCRIVRRSLNGVKRWFVQLVVEGLPLDAKISFRDKSLYWSHGKCDTLKNSKTTLFPAF